MVNGSKPSAPATTERRVSTRLDIDQMIANYDPAKHEAPVVLGHPETDAPAFGWVEGLRREGDVMLAKLKQVQPEFEELVRSGKFKKRSISFYREPLQLRHLGFLGAMPPGVKGMADVKLCEFRDGNREHQAIDFNQESDMEKDEMKKTFMRRHEGIFREWLPARDRRASAKRTWISPRR
jgi:hypothetical protein